MIFAKNYSLSPPVVMAFSFSSSLVFLVANALPTQFAPATYLWSSEKVNYFA